MIFSRFFKAKWQHKDSNTRITAINDDLTLQNPEHKQILLNLAQQDQSDLVRKTALLKLNDFDVWLEESQNNSSKKTKEFLLRQINLILLDKANISVSKDKKLAYIQNVNSVAGLEAWLAEEEDSDIIISLYEKLNKPQLLTSIFGQKQQVSIQRYLLSDVEDKDLLEKLIKKSCDDNIATLIQTKIADIEYKLELPKTVAKKAQLNLSKFLALIDVSDYGVMEARKVELLDEWATLSKDFGCLAEKDKETFETKHITITGQLDKVFAPKAEAYKQQIIADNLKKEQDQVRSVFETETSTLQQHLTTSIFEFADVDEAAFNSTISTLLQKVSESVLNDYEKKHFTVLLQDLQRKLTQLPVIAQSVSDATYHISKISQLALPTNAEELNERQPIFKDWVAKWKEIEAQASGVLPESIVTAYREIVSHWRKGLAPLITEQKQQLGQTQKKISELNRLISSGKFNIAFGVFKRVEKLFAQLSPEQQRRAQKDFDSVSEKMAELSDWEHYIATPRKQKLLEEIKALVEIPLDNPNDQANKVKEYRKLWNSLGHADDEVERSLNNEFNDCCEQAFAPCRLFYKEQEKIREQHLIVRKAILENVKTLAASCDSESVNWKDVDSQLNQIQQQWQSAGEVERSVYKDIQSQFNDAIRPIKEALKSYKNQNVVLKQSLIEKAKGALALDNVFDGISIVKGLQSDWKEVGYTGAKNENRLWKEFRTLNDSVFNKRDEVTASNKAQQQVQSQEIADKLTELDVQLASITDVKGLASLQSEYEGLLAQTLSIKPLNKTLIRQLEGGISNVKTSIDNLKTNKEKQNWQNIFWVLEQIAVKELEADDIKSSDAFSQMPQSWQKRLTDVMNNQDKADRLENTLMLEIFAGQESPAEYKNERMKVQVKLMQEQMVSGTDVNLHESFIAWLQQGGFNANDLALIERIKPIYC
jgi:hypothetical protein